MKSRAEKRRAEREGEQAPSAVDEAMGGANGITPTGGEVVQSRVPGWPYYGEKDAIQDVNTPWDPAKVVTQPRKKVVIVGFTPSRAEAPFLDPEYEVWCENALFVHNDVPRATRWFDLHNPELIDEVRRNFYAQIDIPVFLHDVRADVPGSVKFPKEQLEKFVADLAPGSANMRGDYETNSISWMILLAMWEGFTTIDIYGVNMSQDTEYRHQKANVEYFLGICRGRGIEVNLPPTSDLLAATHQYGYGSDNGLRAALLERKKEFEGRGAKFAQEIEQHHAEIRQLRVEVGVINGAIQQTEWMLQRCVADHTSMTPDLAEIAPELASGTKVEVMSMDEVQAADAEADAVEVPAG